MRCAHRGLRRACGCLPCRWHSGSAEVRRGRTRRQSRRFSCRPSCRHVDPPILVPDNAMRTGILTQVVAGHLLQITGAENVHRGAAIASQRHVAAIGRGREFMRIDAARQAQHFLAGDQIDLRQPCCRACLPRNSVGAIACASASSAAATGAQPGQRRGRRPPVRTAITFMASLPARPLGDNGSGCEPWQPAKQAARLNRSGSRQSPRPSRAWSRC